MSFITVSNSGDYLLEISVTISQTLEWILLDLNVFVYNKWAGEKFQIQTLVENKIAWLPLTTYNVERFYI